jgi:hypothetical protein
MSFQEKQYSSRVSGNNPRATVKVRFHLNVEKRKVCNMNAYPFLLMGLIILAACSPANNSTPAITEATLPASTLTAPPTPEIEAHTSVVATPSPPRFGPNILNYRGNPQRTGVYDEPAIRQLPEIKWQSKINTTWLMPSMIAEDILYTGGGGDGWLYALDIQTGEKIWAAGDSDKWNLRVRLPEMYLWQADIPNLFKDLIAITARCC